MALTRTPIVVKASGTPAAGVWPHFKLLVDGVKVGEANVASSKTGQYAFTANLEAGKAHKIQVQYDNDAVINDQDRNLAVQSLTVNGKSFWTSSPLATYDKGALDGHNVLPGQNVLPWNGTLGFALPASTFPGSTGTAPPPPPTTTPSSTIVVNAGGDEAAGVKPHMVVLVDGVKVGEAGVSGGTVNAYTFKAAVTPGQAHTVQVRFDNDGIVDGQDRNLYVESLKINGKAVAPDGANVTLDKGAADGQDVIPGQGMMPWDGTLNFRLDSGYFPGTGGSTTPPAPTPTPTPTPPTGGGTPGGTDPVSGPTPTTGPVKSPAFFVSTQGRDSWSGKLAAPNADGTDGPFATLEHARDAMRADGSIDTTYIRGGTYHLTRTLDLDARDNGSAFIGYPGEKPVLSGGETITGFSHEGNGLYSAKVGTATDLDLTIGGVRQHVAQTGDWDPANPYKSGWTTAQGGGETQITFADGALPEGPFQAGMKAQGFSTSRWSDGIAEIDRIDYGANTVYLKSGIIYGMDQGATFRLMNHPDYIRDAGEFAWRGSDGKLVVKPVNPDRFEQDGVVVARLGTIMKLNDADNVTIKGLTFTDTRYNEAAIVMQNADGNKIGGNLFKNVGAALDLNNASRNAIAGNEMAHLGADGVRMGYNSDYNQIYANNIHHVGVIMKHVAGIAAYGVENSLISHNDISQTSRYGISLKAWDEGTNNVNNVIEYNRLVHTNQETADTGAIEMLGRTNIDTKTTITGNYIEDTGGIGTNRDGQWQERFQSSAVYLDDLANGVKITGNFFKDTGWGGVHVHAGDNITVQNNVSVLDHPMEDLVFLQWRNGDRSTNAVIDHNIVYGETELPHYIHWDEGGTPYTDYNLIHNAPKYAEQQASPSSDAHSVFADPRFKNAAAGDYSLASDSPAHALGIKDLEWSEMGTKGYDNTTATPEFWHAAGH